MADNTNTQEAPPVPPTILTGPELYDHIMGPIEPELLSANLPQLKQMYAAQTPEERTVFSQKYKKAFVEYERRLAVYQQQWNQQLSAYKRHAIAYIEHQSAENETSQLQTLESSINE